MTEGVQRIPPHLKIILIPYLISIFGTIYFCVVQRIEIDFDKFQINIAGISWV